MGSLAFAPEWTNPILYLNFFGFLASTYLFLWMRDRSSNLPLKWGFLVFMIGTGLHFLGDLFAVDENVDHIFIHGVVLVAMGILAIGAMRQKDADSA